MAENNNNSNDNGGADDEILAAIQSHITKAKSREACYVFGDVIKDPMKAIYGNKWRAVVAKKSGRLKIRCIDTLLLFRGSGWAS